MAEEKLSLHEKKVHKACCEGDIKGLEKLLQKKATPDVVRNGVSALMATTKADYYDCAKLLLKYGANFMEKDEDGNTALIVAIIMKNSKTELAISNFIKEIASRSGVSKEKTNAKETLAEAAKQRLKQKDAELKNKGGAALHSKLAIKAEREATRKSEAANQALITAQQEGDEEVIKQKQQEKEDAEKALEEATASMKSAMELAGEAKAARKQQEQEEAIKEATRLKLEEELKEEARVKDLAARAGAIAAVEAEVERADKVAEEEYLDAKEKGKNKLVFNAKKKKRAEAAERGEVLDATAEYLTGKGALGREIFEKKLLIFYSQTQRLEVISVVGSPPIYDMYALAHLESGTAIYKAQGLRGRRHRIDVEVLGNDDIDMPLGATASTDTTITYARGDVVSLMFDSKELAMKFEVLINSAQRTKEAKTRKYLEARVNKDDKLIHARNERKESMDMRAEHLYSFDSEIVFEEIAIIAREKVWNEYEEKVLEDLAKEEEKEEQALKLIRNKEAKAQRRSSLAVKVKTRDEKRASLEAEKKRELKAVADIELRIEEMKVMLEHLKGEYALLDEEDNKWLEADRKFEAEADFAEKRAQEAKLAEERKEKERREEEAKLKEEKIKADLKAKDDKIAAEKKAKEQAELKAKEAAEKAELKAKEKELQEKEKKEKKEIELQAKLEREKIEKIAKLEKEKLEAEAKAEMASIEAEAKLEQEKLEQELKLEVEEAEREAEEEAAKLEQELKEQELLLQEEERREEEKLEEEARLEAELVEKEAQEQIDQMERDAQREDEEEKEKEEEDEDEKEEEQAMLEAEKEEEEKEEEEGPAVKITVEAEEEPELDLDGDLDLDEGTTGEVPPPPPAGCCLVM